MPKEEEKVTCSGVIEVENSFLYWTFRAMKSEVWRWAVGLFYIFLVATIWIASSFVVQTVVDGGVSPFLVTYICNSLLVVYIPLVEIGRYLEDKYGSIFFWLNKNSDGLQELGTSEEVILLYAGGQADSSSTDVVAQQEQVEHHEAEVIFTQGTIAQDGNDIGLDAKGRWTRRRVARVSLVICPFWFMAQLTFNLSLKYTTVTSNTILSSASSLFTFLVALVFLGDKFTWLKLISVLLCMGGTMIVSLGDSETGLSSIASNPVLGDVLALLSAGFYAVYITLIRKKMPDEDDSESVRASMAQFLGFLGLFNILIFLPVALVLDFAKLEPFNTLTWKQFGLIVSKGLLDNASSDYLWPMGQGCPPYKYHCSNNWSYDSGSFSGYCGFSHGLTGNAPHLLDYIGAAAVMVGFAGINIPSEACSGTIEANLKLESGKLEPSGQEGLSSR